MQQDKKNKLVYTNIQHNFRRFHGLSNTEYVLLDMINVLCQSDNKSQGWCWQSKETMAFEMELSKPAILKMIEKMIVNGFLIKHPQTKYLRTTDKWKETYFADSEKQKQWLDGRNELLVIPSGKESLPRKAVKNIGKQSLPSDGKQSLPKEDFSGKESLPNNNTSFYNNSKDNNREENLQFSPPLQTNLSEIPTGSEKTEKPINPDFYGTPIFQNLEAGFIDFVNSEKKQKKPNSGGGAAQNVSNFVSEVDKPAKPKKTVREWFKLSSLTEEQKGKIRELARSFDSPGDFGESLKQWLEYKEAGEINFRNQKINPYKNFETMLKEVTSEANKCKGQSEVFKQAVQHSIDKLYLGLFPEKFISQTVKNGNFNSKIDRATANNEYLEALRRGEKLPY